MYQVTNNIPRNWNSYYHGRPLIVLEDEYGGQSVIAKDDGCFVLWNGSDNREFRMVKHWYPEAIKALVEYKNKEEKRNKYIKLASGFIRRMS